MRWLKHVELTACSKKLAESDLFLWDSWYEFLLHFSILQSICHVNQPFIHINTIYTITSPAVQSKQRAKMATQKETARIQSFVTSDGRDDAHAKNIQQPRRRVKQTFQRTINASNPKQITNPSLVSSCIYHFLGLLLAERRANMFFFGEKDKGIGKRDRKRG